jgi:hypothetical protein
MDISRVFVSLFDFFGQIFSNLFMGAAAVRVNTWRFGRHVTMGTEDEQTRTKSFLTLQHQQPACNGCERVVEC